MISTLLPLNIEALPEFEILATRFLTHWAKDKLMVQQSLNDEFPTIEPNETLIDTVHQNWLTRFVL